MDIPPRNTLMADLGACHDWLLSSNVLHPEVVIDNLPGPDLTMDGRLVTSFSSNNYLGLSRRPEVLEAASAALGRFTMGTCESRRLGGNLRLLEQLEQRLALFKKTPAAMVFATGLLANVAVIPGLMDAAWYCSRFHGMPKGRSERGMIFADSLNHRSIQMGIRLSRARSVSYRHGDMSHLEQLLKRHSRRKKLIVTDGVFSMDGDLAPLPEITGLAARHDAAVMVDDAHGTGVFGSTGRGVGEHFAVEREITVHMGTMSKAVGAMGGFVACDPEVIAFLKLTASGYRFTSSLPAEQAAGIIRSLDIMESEPLLRGRLWRNVYDTLKGITDLGLSVPLRWSPIVPVALGSVEKCREAEKILLKNGLLCFSVAPPLVPQGESRLRVSLNATHRSGHIEKLLGALEEMDDRLGLGSVSRQAGVWQRFLARTPDYIRRLIALTGVDPFTEGK